MKLLTLAVLLAVMQASPPIPRKAADHSAQTTSNIESKSASNQADSLPAPSPQKANSTRPTKTDSSQQHPDDAQHTVRISEPVTVAVNPAKRDWADWAYWGFNCLLVGVGILQVVLLCWTFRAVRHQAHESTRQRVTMRRQLTAMQGQLAQMSVQSGILNESVAVAREAADAASLSAQALINSERPWLLITGTNTNNQNTAYEFRAANYGRTPLEIIYEKADTRIVSGEDEVPILFPKGDSQLLNVPPLLPLVDLASMQQARQMPDWATVSRNIKGFFPLTILNGRGQGDVLDVKNSARYIVVFGIVTYRNVLNQQRYYTRFCYRWNYSGGVILYGPQRANEHGIISTDGGVEMLESIAEQA